MIRIADNYSSIREAMLALRPTAPAIVHAGNLMPISSLNLDDERFLCTIEYPFTFAMAPVKAEGEQIAFDVQVHRNRPIIRTPVLPRMTIVQLDRWNELRAHTGMKLRAVLQ